VISKSTALKFIVTKLQYYNVDKNVVEVSKRKTKLYPYPPPGANEIVNSRALNA
jgi:hypothetical protein